MAITWTTLRNQIRDLLAQASTSDYTDAQLLIYANWALDDFTANQGFGQEKSLAVVADGTTTSFDAPADMIEVNSVKLSGGDYAEPYEPFPGSELPTSTSYTYTAYWMYANQLHFNEAPAVSSFTLYYKAYYTAIAEDADSIAIPRWAEQAVAFYAGYVALSSQAVGSGDVRQWNQRQDSGNPEHNPLGKVAEQFYAAYLRICQAHQSQEIPIWQPR